MRHVPLGILQFIGVGVDVDSSYFRFAISNLNFQVVGSSVRTKNKHLYCTILKLIFVLSNNYFMFNDNKVFKQIHGCAPLLLTSVWKRSKNRQSLLRLYVDDSFCIIKKDEIAAIHNTLNSMDQHITFTIDRENNGQIAFLDTLVSRNNGTISINTYTKPTDLNRCLDFNSQYDKRQSKHRGNPPAQSLEPNTTKGRNQELDKFYSALQPNGYPSKFFYDVQT